MPRFTFVIGKGGVGKTTVSSALALYNAARHPRSKVLLLSTDPAHSLADVLQTKLADLPKKVRTKGRVYARQLDAEATVATFLNEQREGILRILEAGSLFTREELQPLLDSALPGMAEVAALLAIHNLLASDYDEVIIDTAPMGHTLRLFQLPVHLERFLRLLEVAGGRDQVLAAHFGGRATKNPYLSGWQQMVAEVTSTLDANHARIVLVTSTEMFSLHGAVRARQQLLAGPMPLEIRELVLNRIVRRADSCTHCKAVAQRTRSAEKFLRREFGNTPTKLGEDPGEPILGTAALLAFGKHVFDGVRLKLPARRPSPPKETKLELVDWPSPEAPLVLTLGKGGVGKTTISAGLAFHARQANPKERVTICSIDPAPSLQDVFGTPIGGVPIAVLDDPKLQAAEIDAVSEYQRWAEEMQQKVQSATTTEVRGVHMDLGFERDLFLAVLDVVPPGVDEIFAAFRILDLQQRGGRVQIDMAPTGHALEVLRTPARVLGWTRVLLKTLAHHRTLPLARDAAVEIATVSQRVRELAATITDPKRSRVWVVMLAEPLPDRETRRLLKSLKEMHAPVAGVFVNRVLLAPTKCGRCKRARSSQHQTLLKMRNGDVPIYVVPEYDRSIAGKRDIQHLTETLWRLR